MDVTLNRAISVIKVCRKAMLTAESVITFRKDQPEKARQELEDAIQTARQFLTQAGEY